MWLQWKRYIRKDGGAEREIIVRWLGMDLSKYLPDADTLAEMTPEEDDVIGVSPDVPLSELDRKPEVVSGSG